MNMKYFRDSLAGEVFAFEGDGSQDAFIPEGLIEMTTKEVSEHLAPPVLTEEELSFNAGKERDSRLAQAAIRIAPLQDAVDFGEATASEEQALTAWKRYRITVNRIIQQPGYPSEIDWPVEPS